MENADTVRAQYVVPRYREGGDTAWYHVLHGTVPGHQIDFMYAPEVPQGRLTQTHFGHLARLMKYMEPRRGAPYAFALGNLSRDDIQHEPGHGGLALIFALRVAGVTDHAGRAMPPYAHGVLAIDRAFDYAALLEAISVFYRRFLAGDSQAEDATGSFYRSYVRVMQEHPETVERFLHDYVTDFDELPQPPPSRLGWDWEADEAALPKRVTIVHADDEPFANLAHAAALLGAMLYRSNIKWTTISSDRGIEIPGGTSIRFVPASEAPRDAQGIVLPLGELPEQEEALASKVFGARSRHVEAKAPRAGWRQAMAASRKQEDAPAAAAVVAPVASPAPVAGPVPVAASGPAVEGLGSPPVDGTAVSPRPSTRPPPPASATADDDDLDSAATLRAPLEEVPPAAAPPPEPPAAPATAPPQVTAATAPPAPAVAPAAFDARRSSPTTGVAAATFDARRSSPTTGVVAATAPVVPATPPPRVESVPPASQGARPPLSNRALTAGTEAADLSPPRFRTGVWIGLAGGLAVIAAIVYAVAGGGNSNSDGPAPSGGPTVSASPLPTTSVSPAPTLPPGPVTSSTTAEPGPAGTTAPGAPSPEVTSSSPPANTGKGSPAPTAVTPPAPTTTTPKTPSTTTKPLKPGMKGDLRGL